MVKTVRVSNECHKALKRLKGAGDFKTYEDLQWYLMRQADKKDFTNIWEGIF